MKKSLIKQGNNCFMCGKYLPLECHHLVFGRYRSLSDKYGLTIMICRACHSAIHHNKKLMDWSRALGQRVFEKHYGHDRWMKEAGKNFL